MSLASKQLSGCGRACSSDRFRSLRTPGRSRRRHRAPRGTSMLPGERVTAKTSEPTCSSQPASTTLCCTPFPGVAAIEPPRDLGRDSARALLDPLAGQDVPSEIRRPGRDRAPRIHCRPLRHPHTANDGARARAASRQADRRGTDPRRLRTRLPLCRRSGSVASAAALVAGLVEAEVGKLPARDVETTGDSWRQVSRFAGSGCSDFSRGVVTSILPWASRWTGRCR
jgi:hypothetical protein